MAIYLAGTTGCRGLDKLLGKEKTFIKKFYAHSLFRETWVIKHLWILPVLSGSMLTVMN